MNLFIKMIIFVLALLITSYYLYFYISPSVTVINNSGLAITEINVTLPRNNLNFGSIESGQKNTIYYSLSQEDGVYEYSIQFPEKIFTGVCGYLTGNEINKRFVITINKSNVINCSQ